MPNNNNNNITRTKLALNIKSAICRYKHTYISFYDELLGRIGNNDSKFVKWHIFRSISIYSCHSRPVPITAVASAADFFHINLLLLLIIMDEQRNNNKKKSIENKTKNKLLPLIYFTFFEMNCWFGCEFVCEFVCSVSCLF